MTHSPVILLIHGGGQTGACWDPVVACLQGWRPDVSVVAVDWPGRRNVPGDLAELTIAEVADSIVRQLAAVGDADVVVVGHSLGGVVIPEVAARLGRALAGLVYVSAAVPPAGRAAFDLLPFPMGLVAGLMARARPVMPPMREGLALRYLGHDMNADQQDVLLRNRVPECARLGLEPVRGVELPDVPTTWILSAKDKVTPPRRQRSAIKLLGGVDTVVELSTGHVPMISAPEAVAAALLDVVDRL